MGSFAPYLMLTAVIDGAARPAAMTVSHGEALERALQAVGPGAIAGLDVAELTVHPQSLSALKRVLSLPADAVAAYDIVCVSRDAAERHRKLAAGFQVAQVLWTLEQQGALSGAIVKVQFDLPKGWSGEADALKEKLTSANAFERDAEVLKAFDAIKARWQA